MSDDPHLHGRIEKQTQLPFRHAFAIAWKNIRVRLFRSLLVTSGIILAIAFLTYILCSDALLQSVKTGGSPELIRQLKRDGVIQDAEATADGEAAPAHPAGTSAPAATARAADDERTQTWWLVGLALMVSFVGILNAMLLSVTERFAEIGTMKCLGALDFLIVELFLLESALQGLVGTAIGVCIGLALTLFEGLATYGAPAWGLVPVGPFSRLVGICLLAGTVLTILAALYPAWRAAKMQPVDAMRSEI